MGTEGNRFRPRLRQYPAAAGFRVQQRGSASVEDPDPTTGVGKENKKKQKKREIEVVETGDDDEEDDKRVYSQLGKSQTASAWKRIRRISSDGGSKRVESEGELLPDIPEDKDLDQLRQERDEVEEKLKETSRKLEAITWDDKARCYHEAVRVCVQRFHKALMNNLGKGEESEEVKEQRSELERCIITEAAEGFKIGVCDDFIERIEKTVYVGEVPENKLSLTKIDNTVNNIVEGFVRDVTYELGLPLVVKQEKVEKLTAEDDDDDDDLKIVGYTEATIKPVAIREVKREPQSPPPASPKNPAEKEVRAPQEHGTPRKEVPEVSEAETSDRWNSCERSRSIWELRVRRLRRRACQRRQKRGRVQFRPHRLRSRQKSRKPKWTHRILTLTLKTCSHPRNLTLKKPSGRRRL